VKKRMDIEILENLGLTQSEIKIYLGLLNLGSSKVGPLLNKTVLQSSVVHRALNSLIKKGLVNFIIENHSKLYDATDPDYFIQYIDDKKNKFLQVLPELKKIQLRKRTESKATIYFGKKAMKEVYYKMINIPGAKEYITFGGGIDCNQYMGDPWWRLFFRKKNSNNLKSRQVFDDTVRSIGVELRKLPLTKIKFLPKEFAQFQETVIAGDCVAINVFVNEGYSFFIKDTEVAKGYKKYFELLWKMAKK
jgi:sugar-specific transcriptional regulator TrmB